MRHRYSFVALLALAMIVPALPALAQSNTPWLPPTYQSPPNLSRQIPISSAPLPHAPVVSPPPPIVVPQTGQVLPNLRTIAPSGPHGRESYQDRAARCAHQAGTYGERAGDRDTYINTCINQ